MKKKCKPGGFIPIKLPKMVLTMKCLCLSLLFSLQVAAVVRSQNGGVTLSLKDVFLSEVFSAIQKNSDYSFIYNMEDVRNFRIGTLEVKDVPIREVLLSCLKNTGLSYRLEDNVVVIVRGQEEKKVIVLRGLVRDARQQPLPGVTIRLAGTTLGTVTDAEGRFAMTLPLVKGKLELTCVGYKKKTVEFTEKTSGGPLTVTMEEDVQALDEAVVVGYGTTTKRETTGSISVVKADEIKGIPSPSIANLLQGRVAGMDVTNMSGAPGGGGTSIVIRGYNSLDVEQNRRFSNPLWVVDGVPLNSFTSPVTGTNLLSDINPEMIESIQVLKDASSAAIYGSRAANGVIIVTTKKGRKNQDATFSVNASQSWSILPRLHPVTLGRIEREMRLKAIKGTYSAYLDPETLQWKYPTSLEEVYEHPEGSFDGAWIPDPRQDVTNGSFYQDSLNPFYNNATNYFPIYYETGKVTNANIQTYGGGERMTYGIGLGYYDESGILKGTGFNRIDMNVNLNVTPVPRLNVDMRVNGSLTDRKRGDKIGNLGAAPSIETVPGDPMTLSTLMPGEGSEPWENVLEKMRGTKEKNRMIRLRSNFKLGYDVIDGLNLSTSLAADYSVARRNYFQPSYLSDQGYSKSVGETAVNLMVLNENLLNYNKTIGEDHNINFVGGFSYQYDQMEYNGGSAMNSPSDKIYYAPSGFPDYGVEEQYGTQTIIPFKSYWSDMQEKVLVSWFARLEYNYRKKYLFSASFRRDGSSTFGAKHRWGTFPSVAAGWTFSEENLLKDHLPWLSFGKLRASWGRSGMHFDYPYLALGILESGQPFEGTSTITPNFDDGLYNEKLSWEETDQYDIGVDLDFFDYRLGIVADYYYRYTDNLLMQVALPRPNSYYRQWRNAAAISNEGIEILVKYEIFRRPDLYWKVSVNWAKNWNRFEKSYDKRDTRQWIIGKSLNGIYAMKTDGFVDQQNELSILYNGEGWSHYMGPSSMGNIYYKPGDLKYIDVNGDGSADEENDAVYIGSALPFASGGLVSEFRWKNIDVNLSMSYQLGRHIFNRVPFMSFTKEPAGSGSTLPFLVNLKDVTFWEKPGDQADYEVWQEAGMAHYRMLADRYVEKVNWLKLKTLSIGYSLPQAWMKKIGIEQIRFFASGENLFTVTNYSGIDPEAVDITTGVDKGMNYPLARKFTLGITLKF